MPLVFLWKIIVFILVPIYRMTYSTRKSFDKIYSSAKNRLMFLLANRFTVHVIATLILSFALIANFQSTEVRAETFGENSLMYKLVADQGVQLIEEYVDFSQLRTETVQRYSTSSAVRSLTQGREVDMEIVSSRVYAGEATRMSAVSSGRSDRSVAPRQEIINYTVDSGDTLSTIANRFGISLNTLLWANDLTARSTIRPGVELVILPVSGVAHEVVSGDSIDSLANKYKAESADIIRFNRLADSSDIKIGEKLVIPGGKIEPPKPAPRPATVARVFTPPRQVAPAPRPTQVSGGSGVATGRMIWPTNQRIITQYFGWRHTGLDINCGLVDDNYAADNGTVIFSGWKGDYGYTIDIDHGNGIVTRYAHHARLYVNVGDYVTQGTPVGLCGTTGRSTGTHIHFEVIVNGSFRNPLEYIR